MAKTTTKKAEKPQEVPAVPVETPAAPIKNDDKYEEILHLILGN